MRNEASHAVIDAGRATAVIGCNGAIGRALTAELIRRGQPVIGFDAQTEPCIDGLAFYEHVDLTACEATAERFAERCRDAVTAGNEVCGLAVTTGLYPARVLAAETAASAISLLQANALLPLFIARQFADLPARVPRALVAVSSLAAVRPRIGNAVYAASKTAMESLLLSLAAEYQDKRMRVNVVRPGYVASRSRINPVRLEYEAGLADEGGVTQPTDIVETMIWLLSETSRMVNGETLAVDAGRSRISSDCAWL